MADELPLEQTEKYPDEKLLLGFNFGRDVARGVTIASIGGITVTALGDASDTDGSDIAVSGETIVGKRVQAFFAGGVAGETYRLAVQANMSDGQAPLEIHGLLYIKTDGAS